MDQNQNNYPKKYSIAKWVLIYAIGAAVIYGVVYSAFFYNKKDNNYNLPPQELSQNEEEGTVCTQEYNPVCGDDGKTYSNECMANAAGIKIQKNGECALLNNPPPAATQKPTQTIKPTPSPSPSSLLPAPPPSPVTEPEVGEVSIILVTLEADDYGFYPSSEIIVSKGDNVELTFKVRSTNVYYAGLDVISEKFNTGRIDPGSSKTVKFIADQSFNFTSYWPSSGVVKAHGKITVK